MSSNHEDLIARYGAGYIRCLIAAEQAVRDGRFDLAKLFRVAGCVQRTLAMQLARIDSGGQLPPPALTDDTLGFAEPMQMPEAEVETNEAYRNIALSRQQMERLLIAGITAMETGVPLDTALPEILWVCLHCGTTVENPLPDTCPVCGAVSAEFDWFGPFYADTQERLGQISPSELVTIAEATLPELSHLLTCVPEDKNDVPSTVAPWSIKELIGHFIEVEREFQRRVTILLERDGVLEITPSSPPWKMHEGKDYNQQPINNLMTEFTSVRTGTLSIIRPLTPQQWSRRGVLRNRIVSIIDLGTWLANHDLGHLAQLRRMCAEAK